MSGIQRTHLLGSSGPEGAGFKNLLLQMIAMIVNDIPGSWYMLDIYQVWEVADSMQDIFRLGKQLSTCAFFLLCSSLYARCLSLIPSWGSS